MLALIRVSIITFKTDLPFDLTLRSSLETFWNIEQEN